MKNTKAQKIVWVEAIRAFALLWIFFNHVSEQVFGYPLISNPSFDWPSFSDRINQLIPLNGFGGWNIPVNILRYAGWFGDQGVQLFLIASGFGLTWGLLHRQAGQPLNIFPFSMRNILTIAGKELRGYFVSPMGWVVMGLFALLFGYFFIAYLEVFVQRSMQSSMGGGPVNVNQDMIRGVLANASVLILFLLPMITMRAYAEEKRSGTT